MQLDAAIGEEDERGRSNRGLSHVENLYPLPHGNRSAFEVHMLEEPVHVRCRDALAAFGGYFLQ